MTVVRARLGFGREVDFDTFSDITEAAVVGVRFTTDGRLEVEFAEDLPAEVVHRVRIRIASNGDREEAVLVTLLGLRSEKPATAADRIDRLERAVFALIRLGIGDLSGTD